VYVGELEDLENLNVIAAGIDAPLSFPTTGNLRECEKELLKLGIRLFPSGASFFRKVTEKGIEIAETLSSRGIVTFEVYPYATRFVLDIAPKAKKFRKEGRKQIISKLKAYVTSIHENLTHDEIDAVLSALTVALFYEGRAKLVSGKDGSILIPSLHHENKV